MQTIQSWMLAAATLVVACGGRVTEQGGGSGGASTGGAPGTGGSSVGGTGGTTTVGGSGGATAGSGGATAGSGGAPVNPLAASCAQYFEMLTATPTPTCTTCMNDAVMSSCSSLLSVVQTTSGPCGSMNHCVETNCTCSGDKCDASVICPCLVNCSTGYPPQCGYNWQAVLDCITAQCNGTCG